MKKVNLSIKYSLINEKSEYNIKGIYKDSKIIYFEDDIKMIVDTKEKTINRIKNNEEIILDFTNKKCNIYDKENNVNIEMDVDVLKLECNINEFYVEYKLPDNDICIIKIKIFKEIS